MLYRRGPVSDQGRYRIGLVSGQGHGGQMLGKGSCDVGDWCKVEVGVVL